MTSGVGVVNLLAGIHPPPPKKKTRFEMHCDLIESLPHKTVLCCTLSAPQDKHTLQGADKILFLD